jgi:SAM-dependent methyltransferase
MNDILAKTVNFWDRYYRDTLSNSRTHLNFWDVPAAVEAQRRIAFPEGLGEYQFPTLRLLSERVCPGVLERGISIGCGSGHKEIELLRTNLVKHMTLVEVVPSLIEAAKSSYADADFAGRAAFFLGDFREHVANQTFDLVYFDNALHHMYHVESVLRDCIGLLRPGGFFVMDDFVGPTYNQFDEKLYSYAEYIRGLLPASIFEGRATIKKVLGRITVQDYLDSDPSEACDSGSILPSIAKLMPGVEIIPTGGLIYYLACREIFGALAVIPDRDDAIIRLLFELDRLLVRANPDLTCYALAIWQKPEGYQEPGKQADWKRSVRWPTGFTL